MICNLDKTDLEQGHRYTAWPAFCIAPVGHVVSIWEDPTNSMIGIHLSCTRADNSFCIACMPLLTCLEIADTILANDQPSES